MSDKQWYICEWTDFIDDADGWIELAEQRSITPTYVVSVDFVQNETMDEVLIWVEEIFGKKHIVGRNHNSMFLLDDDQLTLFKLAWV